MKLNLFQGEWAYFYYIEIYSMVVSIVFWNISITGLWFKIFISLTPCLMDIFYEDRCKKKSETNAINDMYKTNETKNNKDNLKY